jgi:hypothetical protein
MDFSWQEKRLTVGVLITKAFSIDQKMHLSYSDIPLNETSLERKYVIKKWQWPIGEGGTQLKPL